MWLPARLERSTLGDLLGCLHRGSASGRLDLVDAESSAATRASIHFDRGAIIRVEGGGARLGERVATSWDERRRIDAALERARRDGDLAGAALVRDGLASSTQLRQALEAQACERIEKLYAMRRADLRFHVAVSTWRGVEVALDPAMFLHGRPRAVPRTGKARELDPVHQALSALGLTPSMRPTRDAIRRAFRTRAASLHPDRARDPEARQLLARAFTRLTAAYERALAAC